MQCNITHSSNLQPIAIAKHLLLQLNKLAFLCFPLHHSIQKLQLSWNEITANSDVYCSLKSDISHIEAYKGEKVGDKKAILPKKKFI